MFLSGSRFALTGQDGASPTKSTCLLGIGWAILSVLTPFYHPYARLWLPLEAFGWLFLGGLFVAIRSRVEVAGRGARWAWKRPADPLPWFALFCALGAAIQTLAPDSVRTRPAPELARTERLAPAGVSIDPQRAPGGRERSACLRPPATCLLSGARRSALPFIASLTWSSLLEPGDPTSWALLDMAMIRQAQLEAKIWTDCSPDWVLVREIPTTLNLPTLLDIDPAAASGAIDRRVGQSSAVAPETDRGRSNESRAAGLALARSRGLGTVTDLYELTMMAGYLLRRDGRPARDVRAVRPEDARRPGRTWSSPGSSRRSATCSVWRSTPSRSRRSAAGRHFGQRRSVGHGNAGRASVRGRRLVGARGDGRLSGRDAAAGDGAAAASSVGRNAPRWRRSRIRPWWPRRRPGWSPRPAAGRSSSSAPGAGHGPLAGMLAARVGLHRRLRRDQPRRGRAPPGHPRDRNHGPLVGPVLRHRDRGIRGVRARVPRKHDPAGRHLRHARRRAPRRRDRAAGPGHPDRQRRPREPWRARRGRSSISTAVTPVKIVASGDLDEYQIAQLVASGAPIDGFGVGTELITSRDAPALAMVYKLVELDGEGKFKLSPGKKTYPMAKQVFRRRDPDGPVLRRPCHAGRRDGRRRAAARADPSIRPAGDRIAIAREHPRPLPGAARRAPGAAAAPGRSAGLSDHLQRAAEQAMPSG